MSKPDLIQIIIQQLEEKLQVAHASTLRAIDAATDEETVPEHKYDTLALVKSRVKTTLTQSCENTIS